MSKSVEDNIYIFFIKTGKEDIAATEISRCVANKKIVPLNYSVEYLFRKRGETHKEFKPLFPGYLFVRSQLNDDEFVLATYDCVHKSNNIIRLLRYGDSDMVSLRDEEKIFLEQLLLGEQYIKSSCGYIQGDKIIVTDGPFIGKESIIKSIDRHRRKAVIELQIMGEVRSIVIGLEIVARSVE